MSQAAQKAAKKLLEAIERDPFLQGGDVDRVDLRGSPSLQPIEDATCEDERFAPLSGSGSSDAKELRAFLEHEANRVQGPGQVNLGKNVIGKVVHNGKEYVCDFTIGGKPYRTKAAAHDDCVMQASRFVFNRRPDIRELDAEEEQLCTWLAQSGKPVEAAEKYIALAIPRAGELGERVLTEPKFAATVDKAVFFAWSRATDAYSLSDREFPKFLMRYARHKRLTLTLCDSAFQSYQDEVKKAERDALFAAQPERQPEAADFEAMSDSQVDAQYKAVAKAVARR